MDRFFPRTNRVPIVLVTRNFVDKGVSCIQRQFPLVLSWATTIHKSQGTTMDRVVVDIGDEQIGCGCTYVALTPVKALEGLVLRPPEDLQRFRNLGKDVILNRRELGAKLKSLSFPYDAINEPYLTNNIIAQHSDVPDNNIVDLEHSFADIFFDESTSYFSKQLMSLKFFSFCLVHNTCCRS